MDQKFSRQNLRSFVWFCWLTLCLVFFFFCIRAYSLNSRRSLIQPYHRKESQPYHTVQFQKLTSLHNYFILCSWYEKLHTTSYLLSCHGYVRRPEEESVYSLNGYQPSAWWWWWKWMTCGTAGTFKVYYIYLCTNTIVANVVFALVVWSIMIIGNLAKW